MLAVLVAAAGGGLLGVLMELGVFRHVRRKGGSSLVLLLCSLGLYVVIQNMVSVLWGDQLRIPRSSILHTEHVLAGIHLTGFQFLSILGAVVLSALVVLSLYRSLFGKAVRAVASDLELSRTVGISPDSAILSIIAFSSVLAAFAGALAGLDLSLTPTMGIGPLLTGMAAVIIGGKKPIIGVLLASLALGFAQALSVWVLGSRWQESAAFFILMAVLLLRPLGRDQRSVSISG
jgi:branched-subunit amino acid ABC-type transport system permease component